MKFIAQPYYSANVVKIYSLPGATLVGTLALNTEVNGPNCVVLYQASANSFYLFVSYDFGSTGAIDIYEFASISDLTTNPPGIPPATRINLNNSAVGMAIQPGTGDLYVATFTTLNADGSVASAGGVFGFTKSSGYSSASQFQFSSYADAYNDVAQYCANLAFDLHGNLWMTTFQDGGVGNQFLICYTQVDKNAGSSSKFFKINNGATSFTTITTLPGSEDTAPGTMLPFSQPEGIAFDPLGNLWLANNNDDFQTNGYAPNGKSNGTLLKISSSWINSNLLNSAYLSGSVGLTADGYGGTRTITSNDAGVTVYYLNGAKFGGLFFDGFTLYVNDQGNGTVWQFETNAVLSAATFKSSGVSTTYPGNGTMSVFNTTPPSLLIRDVAGDTGAEPDSAITGGVGWESPDIGVTQTSVLSSLPGPNSPASTGLTALASDSMITGGSTAFVYVRVTNTGSADTTGTEVLRVYWAKASAGLNWPAPWDGSQLDSSASKPVLGGVIGAHLLGTIQAGKATVFEFPWANVPNSTLYSVNDQHFCLLARIETSSLYPFGMTFPEQTNVTSGTALINNVENNSKIGWRNVAIVGVAAGMSPGPIRLGVLAANHSVQASNVRFAVQTLNQDGKPVQIAGRVEVHAEGTTLKHLLETPFKENVFRHLGDGRFHLQDIARGIENIHLHPTQVLPFHVEFTPQEDVRDFAVRVVQYADSEGASKVVGGQTFVVGTVAGFPVRK